MKDTFAEFEYFRSGPHLQGLILSHLFHATWLVCQEIGNRRFGVITNVFVVVRSSGTI